MLAALTPVKTKQCVYRAAVFLYWVSREVPQYTLTPTSWFLYVFQFALNTRFLLYFFLTLKFFLSFRIFTNYMFLNLKKNHKSYNAENILSWQTAGFVKCDNVQSQLRHQQLYIMNRIFNTSKAFDIGYYRLQVFFFIDLMKYQPRSVYFHQV